MLAVYVILGVQFTLCAPQSELAIPHNERRNTTSNALLLDFPLLLVCYPRYGEIPVLPVNIAQEIDINRGEKQPANRIGS